MPPGKTLPRIFISYRREDSSGYAGHLYETLSETFGSDSVFMDVDNLQPGQDFVDAIRRTLAECDVLLAIIGRRWVTAADADGRRRIEDEGDFVRLEVEAALDRKIRVIPVLVDRASMPRRQDLPTSIQPLTTRHAIEISDDRRAYDIERLVHSLDPTIESPAPDAAHRSPEPVTGEPAPVPRPAGPPVSSRLKANWQWPVGFFVCAACWAAAATRAWEKWSADDGLFIFGLTGLLTAPVTAGILWFLLRNRYPTHLWRQFVVRVTVACTMIWSVVAQGGSHTAVFAVAASLAATIAIWRGTRERSQSWTAGFLTRRISWKAIFLGIAMWAALGFQPMAGALDDLALLNVVTEAGVAVAIVLSVLHVRRWWQAPRAARFKRDLAVPFVLLSAVMIFWGGVGGRVTNDQRQLLQDVSVTVQGPTLLGPMTTTCKSDESGLYYCRHLLALPMEQVVLFDGGRYVDRNYRAVIVPPLRTTIDPTLATFSLETLTLRETVLRVQPPWPFSSGAVRDVLR